MSKKNSQKLIEEKVILSIREHYTYFTNTLLRDWVKKKKIIVKDSTFRTYLSRMVNNKMLYSAGKGWYSFIKKQFLLETNSINNLRKTISGDYPLLSFSCWSTKQLNQYTHHVLSNNVAFVYSDKDYLPNLGELLRDAGYDVYENPYKRELDKNYYPSDKSIVLRPSISKQPQGKENFAPIEKVLVDFLIENNKLKIMDSSEAENVVRNVINSGRINMAVLCSYAKRRKLSLPKEINKVQNKNKVETVN